MRFLAVGLLALLRNEINFYSESPPSYRAVIADRPRANLSGLTVSPTLPR